MPITLRNCKFQAITPHTERTTNTNHVNSSIGARRARSDDRTLEYARTNRLKAAHPSVRWSDWSLTQSPAN